MGSNPTLSAVDGRSDQIEPDGQGDDRRCGHDHCRRQDHAKMPVQKIQDVACHDAPSQTRGTAALWPTLTAHAVINMSPS